MKKPGVYPAPLTRGHQKTNLVSITSGAGFTLVEVLVAISIIILVATVAIISVSQARQKGRDTKRITDVKQIQKALELYYNDNQGTKGYPVTPAGNTEVRLGRGYDCGPAVTCQCINGNGIVGQSECPAGNPVFMAAIPAALPPPPDNNYFYRAYADVTGETNCSSNDSGQICNTYLINFELEKDQKDLGLGTKCSASPATITCCQNYIESTGSCFAPVE